jgi:signal transduction histidine kinase
LEYLLIAILGVFVTALLVWVFWNIVSRADKFRNLYDKLRESQDQLIQSEKMASLGQMVAGVAHEMNTPLGYISNNVAMVNDYLLDIQSIIDSIGTIESTHKISKNNLIVELKKIIGKYRGYELSERQRETLDLLEDSDNGLKEMSQLVSSLKDFSRLDKKQVDEVDIHQGLESTLKISNNIIKHNNVTLQLEYSDLPTVKCNPSKINQVFLNIITNACQAMIDGGTLTIKTAKQGNNISILFKDSGVGMDKETQKNIFDPFYTTKEIGKGTGLGMSISYKIINEHKGRIEVESQLGIGTSITVVLPIG